MKYCTQCGTQQKDDAVFCTKCGNRFNSKPEAGMNLPTAEQTPVQQSVMQPLPPVQRVNKKLVAIVSGIAAVLIIGLITTVVLVLGNAGKTEIVSDPEIGETELDSNPEITETPFETHQPQGSTSITAQALAEQLKSEFADRQTVEYMPPLFDVPRDYEFVFDADYVMYHSDARDTFGVYTDKELTNRIDARFNILHDYHDDDIPEGHSRIVIFPDYHPVGAVRGGIFDVETYEWINLEESGEFYLHETEPHTNWGYSRQFYLVQYKDLETGMPLRIPQVTIFTIENTLEAPQSEFYVTPDGYGAFRWEPVADADYYLVVEIMPTSRDWITIVDKTTDTFWVHPEDEYGASMNGKFSTWEEFPSSNFSVIAVNSQTHSALGPVHDGARIAAQLPFSRDWDDNLMDTFDIDGVTTHYIWNIVSVPTHYAIEAANRTSVQRRMIFDFDSAKTVEQSVVFWDWDLDNPIDIDDVLYWEDLPGYRQMDFYILIPFVIEGTIFDGAIAVKSTPETWQADFETVRRQIEDAAPRTGVSVISIAERSGAGLPERKDTSYEVTIRGSDKVYANSPLSAYLAWNMLDNREFIDLSFFPESADQDYLADAFFEAIYQNPMIMHVEGADIPDSETLQVVYRKPADEIFSQQEELRKLVPEIAAQIIDDSMTDFEKSIAINEYLIDTAEYDIAALENAELSGFQTVSERFYDSFTAYGILANNVGVCAGYAATYKLLADAAGLESIVITGFLDGYLPHAWNRVNLDGNWHIVDVANNDNEFFPNAIMHLPDYAAGSAFLEDYSFMLDEYMVYHKSLSDDDEYYKSTDSFYEIEEVAAELARQIAENGSATLRTDYALSDFMFTFIVTEVLDRLGIEDIYGGHWLGVISLTTTAP